MKQGNILYFKNDNGAELTLRSNDKKRYCLNSVDFGKTGEDTYSSAVPFYHGEVYESCKLQPRDIVVGAYLFDGDKELVTSALSPLSCCELTINNGRSVRGKVIGVPSFSYVPLVTFSFVFRAFSPFFLGTEVETRNSGAEEFNVVNVGDVETPCRIVLYGKTVKVGSASGGINPRLENLTTGEYIEFPYPNLDGLTGLGDGARIEINTDLTDRYIRWYKAGAAEPVNGFSCMDVNSTLFSLVAGKNVLKAVGTYKQTEFNYDVSVWCRGRYLEW